MRPESPQGAGKIETQKEPKSSLTNQLSNEMHAKLLQVGNRLYGQKLGADLDTGLNDFLEMCKRLPQTHEEALIVLSLAFNSRLRRLGQ